MEKKYSSILSVNVLPKRRGRINQGHSTVRIDELADEVRLIDKVIVFFPYFLKIINANRHLSHGLHLLP